MEKLSFENHKQILSHTNTRNAERKFQGATVQRSEKSRERKFQGTKVPRSESYRERKFHTRNFRSREGMVLGAKSPVTEKYTGNTNIAITVKQTPPRLRD